MPSGGFLHFILLLPTDYGDSTPLFSIIHCRYPHQPPFTQRRSRLPPKHNTRLGELCVCRRQLIKGTELNVHPHFLLLYLPQFFAPQRPERILIIGVSTETIFNRPITYSQPVGRRDRHGFGVTMPLLTAYHPPVGIFGIRVYTNTIKTMFY